VHMATALLLVMTLSVGAAQAGGIGGRYQLRECADGAVSTTCVCSSNSNRRRELCRAGQWCHISRGVCS
jgi:hypothetical protein